MKNYSQDVKNIIQDLNTHEKKGLTAVEVEKRLLENGKNAFTKPKKESLFIKILKTLSDISTIILIVAAVLSVVLAFVEDGGFIEPIVIFAIVIMNTILALRQERSAEKALEALSTLNSPTCYVIRDGKKLEIDTEDLVVGDIVELKTGDLIPADARLITAVNFTVEEASLTGESEPSEKQADLILEGEIPLGDRVNMIFSGCLVVSGNAKAVVIATGMQTEMGKIAGFLTASKKYKTPLQVRLDKVGKIISSIAIMAAISLFTMGLIRGSSPLSMLMLAVSLCVAAVPETLSLIVTLILTEGVKKMVVKNALIRKIQAVETLGSTSIICSDKTGTLTMNKMTIKRLWIHNKDAISDKDDFDSDYQALLEKYILASNATVETNDAGEQVLIGDSTEKAILSLMLKKGLNREDILASAERVQEIPFSSSRKMMTVIVKNQNGKYVIITKGALDRIPFIVKDKYYMADIQEKHDAFASDALRVIAIASKEVDEIPAVEDIEKDLEFNGFIGIIDPPRPEAAVAIHKAKLAGIRTIMITGDHAVTAAAIARDLGIITAQEGVITGKELNKLTDDELLETISFYSVYARVSPEDKIRIVKAWQLRGEVVAMTGDGVNDAPALKAADVGVAMGINGTEVSKSASDMILTDDKFSTIVEAVSEGRNVFSNIRKLIYFLVVCNISEIIVMLFAEIKGWEIPLTPMLLLLINVIGDGIPAMALAKETSDVRIMNRKPIGRHESFFGGGLMEVIIQQIFAFAFVSLAAFYIGTHVTINGIAPTLAAAQTMTFLVTGWSSILHVFTVRSRRSIFKYKIKENPRLFRNSIFMIFVFALIVVIPPIGGIFGMVALDWSQWLIVVGLSLIPMVIAEYGKFWDNFKSKNADKNRVSYREF